MDILIEDLEKGDKKSSGIIEMLSNYGVKFSILPTVLPQVDVSSSSDKPLTECMVGRDTECNHPKCPVTDEDAMNGKYCTLPLFDYRQ